MGTIRFLSAFTFLIFTRYITLLSWVIYSFLSITHPQLLSSTSFLRFGRSCLIIGHHRLTCECFPWAAVFGSPYELWCCQYLCVHLVIVWCCTRTYCFRCLPCPRLPSTYNFSYLTDKISAKVSKVWRFTLANVSNKLALYVKFF